MREIYIALPFVQFVLSLFLASVVLFSDHKDRLNQIFTFFLAAMALWGITIFGMRDAFPIHDRAYAWEKAALAVIPFSGIIFYHFVHSYTRIRRSNSILVSMYVLGAAAALLSITGQSATAMVEKFYGFAPKIGWAFPVVLAAGTPPVVLAIFDLTKALKRADNALDRSRFRDLRLGAIFSLAGATTDYLPSLGLTVYPLGILGNIGFALITTWAVTHNKLMNLRLVLRRGLAYTTVSSLIFAVYAAVLAVVWFFSRNLSVAAGIIVAVGGVLITSVFFQPLLGQVQTWIDRLFFRERYDRLQLLLQLGDATKDISDFESLTKNVVNILRRAVQADWIAIALPNRPGDRLILIADSRGEIGPFELPKRSTLASWFTRYGRHVRTGDIEADPYLQAMSDAERSAIGGLGAELLVPMVIKGELSSVVAVGPKLVGADYSEDDIKFVMTAADRVGMALENARMYALEMERLRELERLDSLKSNLLLTVSHELKSPLTAIKVSADLLADSKAAGNADPRLERLIRSLRNGVSRLERLTQESLDYAAMQSDHLELHKTNFHLKDIVEESAALFASAVRSRRQTLSVNAQEGMGPTHADPARVERILTNLISNAHKFTAVGGIVSVEVFAEGLNHIVRVSDTGEGISEEELELIFSAYYRSKNADGRPAAGTGLGLTIARYLAQLHGGKLWATSKLGQGSAFTLSIPAMPDGSEEGADEVALAGLERHGQVAAAPSTTPAPVAVPPAPAPTPSS
ncbi:MAG: GAF domain-containing sensor histidine kinase [Chloroflexi bacterium]|nr:GAF domain-containing sensor histidine kinase [Chloroflexota bacterium]